ncbi:fructokinase [Microbacterium sp. W4I4]|uniref:carbohydrate kinase family protein n=1 Tax=Microbacterium sp. W4I4 TaxID=3042295 RepID=UPI002789CEEF|nr:carbohydrate kinase [Microbacterium sp. W4I4]MDQ0614342.1 fructokinase [Microbacterium sp. W4I4]
MTRIAVVGEALVDVVVGGESHAGGSPMNVAVGLTRLGYPSELNAWIGSDGHGDLIRAHLAADGVQLGAGTRSEGPSWTASVDLDADGRAEYAFRLHGDIPIPAIDEYELVHTGSIGALREPASSALLEAFRAAPARTVRSFDPNIRAAVIGPAAADRVFALAASAQIVKLSDEDAAWLRPGQHPADVLRELADGGTRFAVVTRGPEGALALVDGVVYERPALPVTVADTIGAGDAFMSGLLFGLLRDGADRLIAGGAPIPAQLVTSALDTALTSAAIAVSRVGANPPHSDELAAGSVRQS